jgi:hypothetical protein
MTPEGIVLKSILAYLKLCRLGTVRRVNVGQARMGNAPIHPWAKDTRRVVRFGEPGHSDLVLELNRDTRNVYIEVKSATGKPTALQLQFLARQRERGHIAFVARSIQDVHDALLDAGFPVPCVPQDRRKTPSRPSRITPTTETILEGGK